VSLVDVLGLDVLGLDEPDVVGITTPLVSAIARQFPKQKDKPKVLKQINLNALKCIYYPSQWVCTKVIV
jgi:hypothetical protein